MGGRGTGSMSANSGLADNKSLNSSVGTWYQKVFPDDDLGQEINTSLSFDDALNNLDIYYDLFPSDSVIRERVFQELSRRTGKEYGEIYNKWLNGK